MKFLVTGAAGFIGSYTVKHLLSFGHQVVAVDYASDWSRLDDVRGQIQTVAADIRFNKALRPAFEGVDAVIHLAAIASVPLCEEDPHRAFSTNVTATMNMLQLAREHGIKDFVFASSAAVYGMAKGELAEGVQPNPISVYGMTKHVGETMLHSYGNMGMNTAALRYFNVYGAGQDPKSSYSGVITKFVEGAKRGEIFIEGTGHQSRDFVHVSDVARANVMAVGSKGVFNIGTGRSTTLLDLVETMKRQLEFKVTFLPPRAGDIFSSCCNPGLAESTFGFKAECSLDKGLIVGE